MDYSQLDNGLLEYFFMYWFYVVFIFVILTIGYYVADEFLHFIPRK